jgi:hypothetical protein
LITTRVERAMVGEAVESRGEEIVREANVCTKAY